MVWNGGPVALGEVGTIIIHPSSPYFGFGWYDPGLSFRLDGSVVRCSSCVNGSNRVCMDMHGMAEAKNTLHSILRR